MTTTNITTTAAVFMSGNSQAVRLPKEFQLRSKRVSITRRGDEIVLREAPLLVRDVIGKLAPIAIDELPENLEDYAAKAAPSMEGIR
jgi:antitoxin VapB